eukprot:CAMPEP_0180413688 /NCGR_PEP_ID=MMETSP0989-20121125/45215_1 /TAXON_ID=697907 /ORGANISM="non described non described, Strain CCMP2293" /LENGTH=123 /DNA_ID=CAMNT_0022418253 /DNA_START=66 /DNA_END=434 /DNA_ORIENTATION=+
MPSEHSQRRPPLSALLLLLTAHSAATASFLPAFSPSSPVALLFPAAASKSCNTPARFVRERGFPLLGRSTAPIFCLKNRGARQSSAGATRMRAQVDGSSEEERWEGLVEWVRSRGGFVDGRLG